jgi:hypothetical protein
VDRETNNASLIQVLEELSIPAVLPQPPELGLIPAIFDLVTLWGRENEDQAEVGFGRMSLVAPGGAILVQQEYEIDLRNSRRFRAVGRVLGFPAQSTGRYYFRIERRHTIDEPWVEVASVPVWVNMPGRPKEPEVLRNGGRP